MKRPPDTRRVSAAGQRLTAPEVSRYGAAGATLTVARGGVTKRVDPASEAAARGHPLPSDAPGTGQCRKLARLRMPSRHHGPDRWPAPPHPYRLS